MVLAVAASTASGGTAGVKAGKTVTVWLQTDARQSRWLALTARPTRSSRRSTRV